MFQKNLELQHIYAHAAVAQKYEPLWDLPSGASMSQKEAQVLALPLETGNKSVNHTIGFNMAKYSGQNDGRQKK